MNESIRSFLLFGYFLDFESPLQLEDCFKISPDLYESATEQELVVLGATQLRKAVQEHFCSRQKQLVPLSGGLDSRAILATLLENTEARNISTYTFGSPGTYDYEIGNALAKSIGTKHTSYNLNQYRFELDEVLEISKRIYHQTVLFHHWPVRKVDEEFSEHVTWSGFMGDPLTGSHLPVEPATTIELGAQSFFKSNHFSKSLEFKPEEIGVPSALILPKWPSELVSFEEQMDFSNRQVKYVAPQVLMKGYSFKTPFLHPTFADFFLSVPRRFRIGQKLYKQVLLNAFPVLFNFPTKGNAGLTHSATRLQKTIQRIKLGVRRKLGYCSPSVNYIDFCKAIGNRQDLRMIVEDALSSLENRKLVEPLKPKKILHEHLSKAQNHTNLILALASLELNIVAGKTI